MPLRLSLASLLSLGLMLACGGGGGGSQPPAPTGSLSLRLGSDSFPGYAQVVVSLEKVEGSPDGATWTPLGNVRASFDLMALQNGHSTLILPATQVHAATYAQFRLTWSTVNYGSPAHQPAYLITSGGVEQALSMPTTTVVGGPLTLPANGSLTAQIMLSGLQPVQPRAGGLNSFQALGRVLDLAASATITGRALDGTSPLAGVEVFAETVDGLSLATLQRRTYTDLSGTFVLEGLPTGGLYFVVAQPLLSTSCYAAVAGTPVSAATATQYTANLAFSTPQVPGSLQLTITPPSTATQGTWGELRQTLPTGSVGSQTLIVRSQTAATGLSQDQVGFLGLAPGIYGVTAQRSTSGGIPVLKAGTTVSVPAGGFATSTLAFP